MLLIDIAFKHREIDFKFNAIVQRTKPESDLEANKQRIHTFTIGEPALADKLFWVLCGLDKNFTGTINGEGICFNSSSFNNVLAIGDRSMFVHGTIERNIYKALRTRTDKKTAKQRTQEVLRLYDIERLAKLKPIHLEDDELVTVAFARAHFRKIGLVVYKKMSQTTEIDLRKFNDAYIIVIE